MFDWLKVVRASYSALSSRDTSVGSPSSRVDELEIDPTYGTLNVSFDDLASESLKTDRDLEEFFNKSLDAIQSSFKEYDPRWDWASFIRYSSKVQIFDFCLLYQLYKKVKATTVPKTLLYSDWDISEAAVHVNKKLYAYQIFQYGEKNIPITRTEMLDRAGKGVKYEKDRAVWICIFEKCPCENFHITRESNPDKDKMMYHVIEFNFTFVCVACGHPNISEREFCNHCKTECPYFKGIRKRPRTSVDQGTPERKRVRWSPGSSHQESSSQTNLSIVPVGKTYSMVKFFRDAYNLSTGKKWTRDKKSEDRKQKEKSSLFDSESDLERLLFSADRTERILMAMKYVILRSLSADLTPSQSFTGKESPNRCRIFLTKGCAFQVLNRRSLTAVLPHEMSSACKRAVHRSASGDSYECRYSRCLICSVEPVFKHCINKQVIIHIKRSNYCLACCRCRLLFNDVLELQKHFTPSCAIEYSTDHLIDEQRNEL